MACDRIHGAAWLSRQSLSVLKLCIQQSQAGSGARLVADLRDAALRLAEARPAMAPVVNLVARLHYEVLARSRQGVDVVALKGWAQARADGIAFAAKRAAGRAARRAAEIVRDGDVIASASHSANVVGALLAARGRGIRFQVLIARSNASGISYGERMANELAEGGVEVSVVPDASLGRRLAGATAAIIGADTVLPGGSIINGTPSLRLARAAGRSGVPLLVVCETIKFSSRSRPHLEPGFDLIPADLVTRIMTERGPASPDYLARRARTVERYLKSLGL